MDIESGMDDEINGRSPEEKSQIISKLSPGLVQALYKEMLDTSETLVKSFSPGKIIEREDISNFCSRFLQTSQQYHVKGFKSEYIIRREEDHTERYTSLDRFLASDSQGGRVTGGLVVAFHFLVKPPGFEKFQEYKATLIIDSSDFLEKSENEHFILNMVRLPTFTFAIEYVDYSVARSFISMTEEWHKSLRGVKSSPVLNFLKKRFNIFTDINMYQNTAAFFATIASLYSCYVLIDIVAISDGNIALLKFLCGAFGIIYISRFIAIVLMGLFIRHLGSYRIPNFVVLNKKDRENIEKFNDQKKSIIRGSLLSMAGLVLTVGINIMSSYIYTYLF